MPTGYLVMFVLAGVCMYYFWFDARHNERARTGCLIALVLGALLLIGGWISFKNNTGR